MGDRRSPSPSGHITLDIRVILAHIFGPICGDDHPYITRYALKVPMLVPGRCALSVMGSCLP